MSLSRTGWLVAGITVWLAVNTAQGAGPYDPELEYRTLLSPRFAVHYPPGAYNLAVRVSRLAEDVLLRDAALFDYMPPGRIEIVMTDSTDEANGFTQVLPKNMITIYLSAPTELTGLSEYDDWLRILLTHEIAHVCDLDQSWNFTRVLRSAFGKTIQWNGYVPQFLSEGVAVYAETKLTRTGRGRSSYVAMMLRMAALEQRFLPIDQAHVLYPDWPGGNVAYFYGGRFHLWLADKLGADAVQGLHHYYAAQVIPYVYWFGAREVLGASLPDLWEMWRAEETAVAAEVAAGVAQQGITPSTRLTFHGRDITGARYSPDGSYILYSRSSPVDGSTVRQIDRDGRHDRYLVLQTFSPRFSFDVNGHQFYYSQEAINDRFDTWSDLYRYDVNTHDTVRLRDKSHPNARLRARDPAVSPDGRTLVFVQNNMEQSWLSIATVTGDDRRDLVIKTLVGPVDEVQHASPVFAPDGLRLAESVWFGDGRRDIVIVDAQTGHLLRRVTYDRAQDGNPAWSRDGRYLLYESDSDGISNIYAFDTRDGGYYRLTHVVGGAFQPDVAPDGNSVLFRNASGIGFDIHEMPFDPNGWQPQSYHPEQGYRPAAKPTPCDDAPWMHAPFRPSVPRAAEPPLTLHAYERDEPYSPWRTLLPFQDNWWLYPQPYIANLTTLSRLPQAELGIWLVTGGNDALLKHGYTLGVGISRYGHHPNWTFQYVNDVWFPTLSLSVSDVATAFLTPHAYPVELSRSASLAVSAQVLQRHYFVADYIFESRTATAKDAPLLALGRFGSVGVGYQYNYSFQYPYSVGQEHGGSLAASLRWFGTALGGTFDEGLVNLDGRAYINNPLFDNHVLALRLAGAIALGPDYVETFYLGGTAGASFLTEQSPRQYPLRGLGGLLPGTGLLAVYSEYRFPLWHIDRGLWTIPLTLHTLHAAVFCDVGNTFGEAHPGAINQIPADIWRSVRRVWSTTGAELRADIYVGWAVGLTIRLGVGIPTVAQGAGVFGRAGVLPYVDFGTFI